MLAFYEVSLSPASDLPAGSILFFITNDLHPVNVVRGVCARVWAHSQAIVVAVITVASGVVIVVVQGECGARDEDAAAWWRLEVTVSPVGAVRCSEVGLLWDT